MAVLSLCISRGANVISTVNSTIKQMNKRIDDYHGIRQKISSISPSSGNLRDSNVYLRKKNEQIERKRDKLAAFGERVGMLMGNAEAADKRVAQRVDSSSKTFYEVVGIKTGIIGKIYDGYRYIKKAYKEVKEFYEKHKYLIDLIVDIALFAAAIATLLAAPGALAIFFAAFEVLKSAADVCTSAEALIYHLAGDDEQAALCAKRGLRDAVQFLGNTADELLGFFGVETMFGELLAFSYDALSIASLVYSFWKIGASFDFKSTNKIKTIPGRIWNGVKETFGLKTVKGVPGLLTKTFYVAKNIVTVVKTTDSIFSGSFLSEGNRPGKIVTTGIDAIKDGYNLVKDKRFWTTTFVWSWGMT